MEATLVDGWDPYTPKETLLTPTHYERREFSAHPAVTASDLYRFQGEFRRLLYWGATDAEEGSEKPADLP